MGSGGVVWRLQVVIVRSLVSLLLCDGGSLTEEVANVLQVSAEPFSMRVGASRDDHARVELAQRAEELLVLSRERRVPALVRHEDIRRNDDRLERLSQDASAFVTR